MAKSTSRLDSALTTPAWGFEKSHLLFHEPPHNRGSSNWNLSYLCLVSDTFLGADEAYQSSSDRPGT